VRTLAPFLLLAAVLLEGARRPVLAADWDDLLTGYALTSWNDDAGRALGAVYAIAQDVDGYLWIGTDAGLYRFDGSRFTAWERLGDPAVPRAAVRSLWVARDGSVWVGFSHDASVGRIRGGRLTRYGKGLDGLDAVTELVEDGRGTMWAIADRSLFRLAGGQWHKVALPWAVREGQVLHPYVTRAGRLLVGTRWGVFQHDTGTDDRFQMVSDEHVWGLGEDAEGRIWTTDIAAGFRQLGAPAAPRHALEGAGYRLMHDRQGNLWVATFGAGLWRVGRDGNAFTVKRAVMRTGLSSDSVQAIVEDRDGNVWVGTTGGLHRLTRRKLTPIDDIGFVLATEPARGGGLWAGTSNGLLHLPLAPGSARRQRVGPGAPDVRVLHTDPEGVLWIGAADGLWRLDARGLRKIPIPERPQMLVRWLAPAANGGFWLGDNEWLYRWDGSRLHPLDASPLTRGGARITFADADHSGRVWVGFAGGRLGVLDRDRAYRDLADADGLAAGTHRSINAIFEDRDGVVWIGGSGGLSRYADGRIVTLTRRNGLPEDRVWAIVDDRAGSLWLSMDRGVVRIDRAEIERALVDPAHRMRFQAYDALDGVAGSAIGIIGAVRADDRSLWFVRGGGLTHADPHRLRAEPDRPPARVQIAAVVANETPFRPSLEAPLPAGTRRIEIQYTAPTLGSANKVRFRHRLDGVDTRWVDAAAGRTAFYTNLAAGEYRFRVQADVEGGDWNTPPAEWSFRIEPLFRETRWFYALCAGAVVLAVWGAWRARLRLVKRQFSLALAERARLSREIHDTLLQSLVGVALQVDVVSGSLDKSSSRARQQLLRIRNQVEAYIRDARQSIHDLRSPQLEQQDLTAALRAFGRNAVADTGVRFTIAASGTRGDCPPKVENQLLRVGQEAITNAARHARATRIRVDLAFDDESVVLRVSDDGRGFDYERSIAEDNGHYGLRTMRERAEELGGRFTVTTTVGGGTTVVVTVPTNIVAPEEMLAGL
jgi:signal transduction histidine kinase/ligand-binding sensor domain-containing protein